MTLTLISHDLCPYVQRVAIAMYEKGIGFERISIDLHAKPDWFLQISPRGKVPVLLLDDAVLFESNAICEFIEDTQAGPKLHPTDPIPRAQHRAWMEFASATLADIWGLETATEFDPFEAKRLMVAEKILWVEKAIGPGPYFNGTEFSYVDAAFAPIFRYFDLFEKLAELALFDDTPKVRKWRATLTARPSVQQAVTTDYALLLHQFLERRDAYLLKPIGHQKPRIAN
jgi:glutathione S-transferase